MQVSWLFRLRQPLRGACNGTEPTPPAPYTGPPIPWAYSSFPPVEAPFNNPITTAKANLGFLLFYDPILSGDQTVACDTCHSDDGDERRPAALGRRRWREGHRPRSQWGRT